MRNSYSSGAADKAPTDDSFLNKYRYAVKVEGCGNCEPMRRDDFQLGSRGRLGDHRGGGNIQVPWTYAGPVK